MLTVFRIILFFTIISGSSILFSQDPMYAGSDSVIIIPGNQYAKGPYYRFWFGNTWRDLWTTPIKVPLLDIEKFAGGLDILKKGGAKQTRSLHFTGADGKRYKFRSIQKFTDRYLPQELKETLADDVIRDMFSTINPLAAIISAPIINAAGVLHTQPMLCIMPDDKRLGEFRDEYAGLLGTIEEHPDETSENEVFGNANKVFGSVKLFEKLKKSNKYRVDSREFLRARLIDIFLGDWDRHYDQWRWAVYEVDGIKYCKPIPRDRDQAFTRYDGVIYSIVEYFVPQTGHFDSNYPLMLDLTWSGQFLDRRFLSDLDKNEWDEIASSVRKSLTDSVIHFAVRRMPEDMYAKEGQNLSDILIERRNKLLDASDKFYNLLADETSIWASDKDEFARINVIDEQTVNISVFDKKKDGSLRDHPYFERTYHSDKTKEIRIYMLDGKDDIVATGNSDSEIKIYIAAGDGADTFTDNRIDNGCSFLCSSNIIFWDSGKKTKAKLSSNSSHYDYEWEETGMDPTTFDPAKRNWGYDLLVREWFSVNTDDGLFLGGGPEYTKYGFRSQRFRYQMHTLFGYSFFLNGIRTRIRADFHLFPYSHYLRAELYFSQIDVSNFFGIGNETEKKDHPGNYHKVAMSQFFTVIDWKREFSDDAFINLGIKSENAYRRREPNRLIDSIQPFGYQKDAINLTAYRLGLDYDSRNMIGYYTTDGFFFDMKVEHYPNISILDNSVFSYAKINLDSRYFLSFNLLTEMTLALKVRGQKCWGDVPFFDLADIGGSESLRGYNRERYLGDASLSGMFDLRFRLFEFKYIIPIEVGGIFFSDAGRVWLNYEDSDKLHYSYGPGLWLSTYKNTLLVSTYLARMENDFSFYLSTGFLF